VTILDDKTSLRKEMLQTIRSITAEQRLEKTNLIVESLITHGVFKDVKVCGFYASLASEPDLAALFSHPALSEIRFCIPRVSGDGMTFHHATSFDKLKLSSKGIREPEEKAPRILPQEINLIIIPALAYAENTGHRLGRGGGYYDRFLRIPQSSRRIGVCFDEQVTRKVPVDKHDKQVEEIITDKRIITL
jgi:5-formyltetrahydrofolate cyclo-ligase